MADLREQARAVDWEQARADGLALLRKETSLAALPAANRDNLARAHDIMSKLAENEGYYRLQSIARMNTYDDLKKEYVKYIHERDHAALNGVAGAGGLALVNTVDMIGHGLAAAGIPAAKFYTTVRDVADQGVKVANELLPSAAPPAAAAPAANASAQSGGSMPGTSPPSGSSATAPPAAAPAKTSDETYRNTIDSLKLARDVHKAVEETVRQNNDIPGVDRFRGWTTPQSGKAEETTALKISAGVGQGADAALKIATGIADVRAARRSGDTLAQLGAETQLLRSGTQAGATAIELANRIGKQLGNHGESGAFPVSAQVMKGLRTADKVVALTQSGSNLAQAIYEADNGKYDKAWQHARDGVTNAAKAIGPYGNQVEAAGKAAEALKRASESTTLHDKTANYLEYAGNAVKVATIPGANDMGDAILKAKEVVEQGVVIRDSIDLGRKDTFRPGLDRLGNNIREDYELYMRLSEFRPMFELPAQFPRDSFSRTPPVTLRADPP
jgi:hypothetical protein